MYNGVAENTKKTRRQQLKRYRKFCKKFTFNSFPCSPSQASLYATYLADMLKPVSIRNYISAVWYYQKLKGFEDHSTDYMLKMTLDGIERVNFTSSTVRYPMTTTDMLVIYSLLDMNMYVDKIFWLAILIAFRAVLRISHVTKSVHSLKLNDVKVTKDYVRFKISSSKTDQFGRKPHEIYLQRVMDSPLCPGGLLEEVMGISRKFGENIFSIKGKPLKYTYVYTRLKSLAVLANLPFSRVSTHSLRHGGATFLKKCGMSVDDIMKKANWKSKAVFKYLHDAKSELLKLDVLPSNFLSNL